MRSHIGIVIRSAESFAQSMLSFDDISGKFKLSEYMKAGGMKILEFLAMSNSLIVVTF